MKDSDREKRLRKIMKALPPGLAEDIEAMDEAQLRALIIESEGAMQASEAAKFVDDDLANAKFRVSELSEPYKDTKKTQTAKIHFALIQLEDKGKL